MKQYLEHISFQEPTNLEFIKRLTTPTGILQHTKFAVPDRSEGYCVDDNARALLLTLKDHAQFGKHQSLNLAITYLSYLSHSKTKENWFYTYQSFDHQFKKDIDQDGFGRAVWALGYSVYANLRWDITKEAERVFNQIQPNFTKLKYTRAKAYTLLGCLYFQQSGSKNDALEKITLGLATQLEDLYEKNAKADWPWFESSLTYDNALLPQVMIKSYQYFKKDSFLRIGVESLGFLESQSHQKGIPTPVGNHGWLSRGGIKAVWDQQPIDVCRMVMVNSEAYRTLRGENYKAAALEWFSWFHGFNLKEKALYDPTTGGCFDGLGEAGVNLNQGAESTLVYWLAYLELVDLLKKS